MTIDWGPVAVAVIGGGGIIAGAIASSFLGRWAESTDRRRSSYADAVAALVAWNEYPYRIRRRTSDEPDTLERLANIGHDLQERLSCSQTWIWTESAHLAELYAAARENLGAQVGPACREAWRMPPAASPELMNLGDWGPGSCEKLTQRLQREIHWRFGWRRWLWVPRRLLN